jgi:hypothetical protein
MVEQSKGITAANHDLPLFPEEIGQAIGFMCALSVAAIMVYEWDTQRLREVLGREPTDWDRFKYRAYFECARSVKEWQRQCNDDRKLREAAKRDAGLSG